MWPTPPFLYAPTPFVAAASAVAAVVLAALGLSELRGDNLAYSKFSRGGPGKQTTILLHKHQQRGPRLSGRAAMLLFYAPALTAALASFFAVPAAVAGARSRILAAALAAHFLKRVLEVLFVHRYSGTTPLSTALLISSYYLSTTVAMLYAQRLSQGLPDPAVDLLVPGVVVFAVGLAGNFYHHWLLSRLRANAGGDNKAAYKIPTGGLFGLVVCPHYLFEILGFFGFAMLSQTLCALTVAVGTAAYLAGRSYTTRKWYAAKFEDFPATIKALVPYVW
ncbi:hypothetical protein U9M48_011772 [Paspalum notatum var. saurae]|uniref:3-oxo-5-alpha-steroid 4-dehydrogenase C-terminal domain-containing protein n=1 Tax=Paspalum notatum var. saurae TaxID=547442 RepID=A0AAQ3SXQ7_PASNO